ncbi:MAG: alginate export family protein [Phycisphaerales bacterium]
MNLSRCLSLVILAGAASATAQSAQPDAENTSASTTPKLKITERYPLGWLSNPDDEPEDFFDALVSGKVFFNDNMRIEYADTTGRRSSTAVTNRIRLGYQSKPLHGFSGFVEMENVATPSENDYFVPATGGGSSDRTVIADPPGTEMNQAWARYQVESVGDSNVSLDIKTGRQRIILDDSRFIGNVGWRQFEQTLDAVSIDTDLGVDGLSLFYAYVWRVQRIFGPDGPNWDSDSHLLNASYQFAPEITATPFAYFLDFDNDAPANSSNTFGIRLTGKLDLAPQDESDIVTDYELTYARQVDAGSNTVDYEADFLAAQVKVTKNDLGHVVAGYQLLGSDDGNFAFRFPLGTNHKFQGFADNFLVTPAAGLQDLYIGVGGDLPGGIKGGITYHEFWSDQGSNDLGYEVDLVASKQITPLWSVLVKAAFFDGSSGQPDTNRLWAQTTYKF